MYDWDLSNPVLNAWVKLRQASEAMDKVLEIELGKKQTSLTPVAILALLSVSKVPLTPNKLGGYVFREIHSVSQLLKRMVRYGYVKKKRDDKDQRVVRPARGKNQNGAERRRTLETSHASCAWKCPQHPEVLSF